METVSSQRVSRSPKCARCRNHGFVVVLKGHAGRCRFSQCSCWKCALISERTRIMAKQRGIRKSQRAEEHETGAGETGNGIGAALEVNGDPVSGATERVTKSPARGTDTEDKTYTELEVPGPAASGAWAPTTEREIAQKSSDQCKGIQDNAILREQPHLPWEYFVTEIPQNTVYSGDLAMAMPFHLHSHYANAYARPAFLVSFGAPPLGSVGFPHIPQAALMESRQEGPGFFYTPYLLHPKPEHYQQYVSEGADISPLQHGHDSGVIEGSQRRASRPAEAAFP
ncbi:doublesex- and mab-3-related transcription factor DM-W [Pangasianodon hypophthalmus]|uniref:doublesex- and mab-3-related transcription factor DM-W n=1 Tax=Pangasianodon hypophthalmus TaxID=310915 RepID=UPI00230797EB|nr:doublesex- and mab-3-related transcription factor DM-W [Pangasianodon hypophthalmus]